MKNIQVEDRVHRALKRLSAEHSMPISSVIAKLLNIGVDRKYLDGSGPGRPSKYPWKTLRALQAVFYEYSYLADGKTRDPRCEAYRASYSHDRWMRLNPSSPIREYVVIHQGSGNAGILFAHSLPLRDNNVQSIPPQVIPGRVFSLKSS